MGWIFVASEYRTPYTNYTRTDIIHNRKIIMLPKQAHKIRFSHRLMCQRLLA